MICSLFYSHFVRLLGKHIRYIFFRSQRTALCLNRREIKLYSNTYRTDAIVKLITIIYDYDIILIS